MKITINRNILVEALKFSNNVIGNNITNPILNSILFEANNKELKVISSNGLISSSYTIKENIDIEEEGKILVKCKLLLGVISKIKDENIEISEMDSSLQIKTNNYVSNVNTLDPESYPQLEFNSDDWSKIEINSDILSTAIKKVSHSALQQVERINRLNGIFFDGEKEDGILRIVATDSFKLSIFRAPYQNEKFKFLINTNIINLINSFLKSGENVIFKTKQKNVMIQTNNFVLSCNVIDSEYPNIDPVIECKPETVLKVNRHALMDALDRVISFLISDKSSICNIKISNSKLSVNCRSLELGSSKEDIDLLSFEGNQVEFAVNASFLLEHLKAFDNNEVCFKIEKELKPFILYDENEDRFIQVLVPMRSL